MPREKFVNKVLQVSYHRNGVGGAPFHAVIFESDEEVCSTCGGEWGWNNDITTSCIERHTTIPTKTAHRYVASVFDEARHVAVFRIAPLSDPAVGVAFGVAFGENSYRGDRYEDELRAAIKSHQSDGSVRVGNFGMPTERDKKPMW